MRALRWLPLVILVASCDFEAGLVKYCEGNPACLDGGLVATDGGSPPDGGTVGPQPVGAFALKSGETDSQLVGHRSPLELTVTLEDGGPAHPATEVRFLGGAVFTEQGDPVTRGPLSQRYLFGADVLDSGVGASLYAVGPVEVRAAVPLLDGGTLEAILARTFRGRLSLRGANSAYSPYTPFTCVSLDAEVQGEQSNQRGLAEGRSVVFRTLDGGVHPVFGNGTCLGPPVSGPLPLSSTLGSTAVVSVRLSDFVEYVVEDSAGPLLLNPSSPARYRPMPLGAALEFPGQGLVLSDGGASVPVRFPDGGAPSGGCSAMIVSWRHLEQVPGLVAQGVAAGDQFPFVLTPAGGVLLHSTLSTCVGASAAQLVTSVDGSASLALWAIWQDAGTLQISFPDGGASTSFVF